MFNVHPIAAFLACPIQAFQFAYPLGTQQLDNTRTLLSKIRRRRRAKDKVVGKITKLNLDASSASDSIVSTLN